MCKSLVSDTGDEKEEKTSAYGGVFGAQTVKLDGAARGMAVGNKDANLLVVPIHRKKLVFINDLSITQQVDTAYTPSCCALSPDDALLAVGSGTDGNNCVFVYATANPDKPAFVIDCKQYLRGEIVCLAFTADGKFLATADRERNIWIWDLSTKNFEKPHNFNNSMKYHNGQICSMHFGGNGKQLLTCANDSTLYIFQDPCGGSKDFFKLNQAFIGVVRKAIWIAPTRIVGIGGDNTIRFFDVQN